MPRTKVINLALERSKKHFSKMIKDVLGLGGEEIKVAIPPDLPTTPLGTSLEDTVVPSNRLRDKVLNNVLKKDPVMLGEPHALDDSRRVIDEYGRQLETRSMFDERVKNEKAFRKEYQGGYVAEDILSPFTDEIIAKKGDKVTANLLDQLHDEGYSATSDIRDYLRTKPDLKVVAKTIPEDISRDRAREALRKRFGQSAVDKFNTTGKLPPDLVIPTIAGAATVGALAEPDEADAAMLANWKYLAKRFKGTLIEANRGWGIIELPEGELLRIRPRVGVDKVTRSASGKYYKTKRILDARQMGKLVAPTKVLESDAKTAARRIVSANPVMSETELEEKLLYPQQYMPQRWLAPESLSGRPNPVPQELRYTYIRKALEETRPRYSVLEGATTRETLNEPTRAPLLGSRNTVKGWNRLRDPEQVREAALQQVRKSYEDHGNAYWSPPTRESIQADVAQSLGLPRRSAWQLHAENKINPVIDQLLEQGELQTAPMTNRWGHEINALSTPDTEDIIAEARRQQIIKEAQARLATDKAFREAPATVTPQADITHRIQQLAQKRGGLAKSDLKHELPSVFSREPKLMQEIFPTGKKLPPEYFEDALKTSPLSNQYKYTLDRSSKEGRGDRLVFRIHVSPEDKVATERHAKDLFSRGHGEPYRSKVIPTVGWVKVYEHPESNTWFVEEVQSDLLSKARKLVTDQKALKAINQKYKDWADNGLATVLQHAREAGVKEVRVTSPEAARELWKGHLGEAKANTFYRDLPKRFGFTFDEKASNLANSPLTEEEMTELHNAVWNRLYEANNAYVRYLKKAGTPSRDIEAHFEETLSGLQNLKRQDIPEYLSKKLGKVEAEKILQDLTLSADTTNFKVNTNRMQGDINTSWRAPVLVFTSLGAAAGALATPDEAEAISKKQALKMLKATAKDIPEYFTEKARKNLYRRLSKAVRRTPEEELDRIDSIALEHADPGSEKALGQFHPSDKHVNFNTPLASENAYNQYNTFAHELAHARQVTPASSERDKALKLLEASRLGSGGDLLEKQAHSFGQIMARPMQQGNISQELWDKIYSHTQNEASKLLPSDLPKTTNLPEAFDMSPRGVFEKPTKAAGGTVSSSAEHLRGAIIQGKRVVDVRKGQGNFRAIIFDDGTQMSVNKTDLFHLSRRVGTERKQAELAQKGSEDQLTQAIRSMKYHKARRQPLRSRDTIRRLHADYLKRNAEMDPDSVPQTVFVIDNDGFFFQMPEMYTDLLEKQGLVKVVRTKRDMQVLQKYIKQ